VTDVATLTISKETTELTAHDGYLEAPLTDDEDAATLVRLPAKSLNGGGYPAAVSFLLRDFRRLVPQRSTVDTLGSPSGLTRSRRDGARVHGRMHPTA
jgi:hypothetical protein